MITIKAFHLRSIEFSKRPAIASVIGNPVYCSIHNQSPVGLTSRKIRRSLLSLTRSIAPYCRPNESRSLMHLTRSAFLNSIVLFGSSSKGHQCRSSRPLLVVCESISTAKICFPTTVIRKSDFLRSSSCNIQGALTKSSR